MTANDTTYNGWTNYETWVIKLWLDNDQGSQEMMEDMTKRASRTAHPKTELADAIKSMIEEEAPEVTGLYADLLGAAISSANYYEMAEAYLADYDDDEADDDEADDDEQ